MTGAYANVQVLQGCAAADLHAWELLDASAAALLGGSRGRRLEAVAPEEVRGVVEACARLQYGRPPQLTRKQRQ